MMGRKRQQQGSSNSYSGYHGHSAQRDKQLQGNYDALDNDDYRRLCAEFDGSGDDYDDYESAPPCIGLCLLRKSQGLEPPPPVVTKPCVGKCQHRRQLGLPDQSVVRRGRPCVGLCYLAKKRATQERKRREQEREKKKTNS